MFRRLFNTTIFFFHSVHCAPFLCGMRGTGRFWLNFNSSRRRTVCSLWGGRTSTRFAERAQLLVSFFMICVVSDLNGRRSCVLPPNAAFIYIDNDMDARKTDARRSVWFVNRKRTRRFRDNGELLRHLISVPVLLNWVYGSIFVPCTIGPVSCVVATQSVGLNKWSSLVHLMFHLYFSYYQKTSGQEVFYCTLCYCYWHYHFTRTN